MKNLASISVYCLLFALISLSWLPLRKQEHIGAQNSSASSLWNDSIYNSFPNDETASLYMLLDLQQKGLSKEAFEHAFKGYRRLLQKQTIRRQGYLMICDFSQSSKKKRLYLLDMANNEVKLVTYVAHGRNSGGEFATRFSNKPESLQSSLGFYLTQNTYYGEHGLSLRVAGLEAGYNDKAGRRNIVIHGADYIGESWLKHGSYMGRSYGCPAVPKKESDHIINTIKNGSCIFIYHPSTSYLRGSKILNG